MPDLRRTLRAAFALLCLGAATSAHAGEAKGDARTKLAVLEVRTVGTFDAKAVAGLTAVIADEAGRREDLQVISGSEISMLINFQRQRQTLTCIDDACLSEIGAALGVKLLVASEVSQIGKKWLFSVSLLEVATAKSRARIAQETDDPSELVGIARKSVRTLLASGLGQSKAMASALAAERQAAGARRTVGWAVVGVGAASLVGSGVTALLAASEYGKLEDAAAKGDPAGYESAKSATDRWALTTDVLLGVGVAAAAAGAIVVLTSPSEPAISLQVLPSAGGAHALAKVSF